MHTRNVSMALLLVAGLALPVAAEERMVLIRGEPEFPSGPIWVNERDSGGPELERHSISPGRLISVWEARSNRGQYDLYGEVEFELPPERIELDENRRAEITLEATGSFFGETTCCYLSVVFAYAASGNYGAQFRDRSFRTAAGAPLLGTNRFETSTRKPTDRGHESEFRSGDLEHRIEATLAVNGPRDPGPALSIVAIGNRSLQVVFPYTAVLESGPPAIADVRAPPPVATLPPAEPAPVPSPPAVEPPVVGGLLEPPECPVAGDLLDGPIWRGFLDWVQAAYDHPRHDDPAHPAVLGHALGRIATAVGRDEQRHVAFACLENALDLWAAQVDQMLGMPPGVAFQTMWQAAMGMHHDEVMRLTGIADTSPAEDLLTRLTATGRAAVVHPWEGLCVAEIMLVAGASPMFELRSGATHVVVFPDPVGTGLIRVDGCAQRPWNHRAFEAEHAYVESRVLDAGESRQYRRVDLYRTRDGGEARIAHFRR